MFRWYYRKVQNEWAVSPARKSIFEKRGLALPPNNQLFPFESKFIVFIYTLLMPIVLLDFGLSFVINKFRKSK